MIERVRLGIMASGRGSNAEALLLACEAGLVDAEGALVVSNRPDAGVHEVAKRHGVPSLHLARNQFTEGGEFADALIAAFRERGVELIALAGYMRKVPPRLLRAYPRAVLNIHPALLPRYGGKGMYGLRVHAAVIAAGDTETGVTVHYVDEEYDRGPILLQAAGVPVLPEDTPESLAARVLRVEHTIYPRAVQMWIEQRRSAGGSGEPGEAW
ncbi:MAG TPA: phosphoribosylglycinamide formyltransferase [Bacteroidetes bacterium]|nr:phosphoribosylglycinamide formyltransferase [Bacteroidota bacterium]